MLRIGRVSGCLEVPREGFSIMEQFVTFYKQEDKCGLPMKAKTNSQFFESFGRQAYIPNPFPSNLQISLEFFKIITRSCIIQQADIIFGVRLRNCSANKCPHVIILCIGVKRTCWRNAYWLLDQGLGGG